MARRPRRQLHIMPHFVYQAYSCVWVQCIAVSSFSYVCICNFAVSFACLLIAFKLPINTLHFAYRSCHYKTKMCFKLDQYIRLNGTMLTSDRTSFKNVNKSMPALHKTETPINNKNTNMSGLIQLVH